MQPISAVEAKEPIVTDLQVEQRVRELIGPACRRQFWMLFIDDENRQLSLIMPMDDYPPAPDGGNAELLASAIREIIEVAEAAQVIFVWERRLRPDSTPADRAWARTLGSACADEGARVRAQLISHRDGVRWFPLDEYL